MLSIILDDWFRLTLIAYTSVGERKIPTHSLKILPASSPGF